MKRILIGLSSLVLAVLLFAGGILANEWMSFTGEDKIEQAGGNVDRIMEILKEMHDDKITAEEALKELEGMNPPGLVKQIEELKSDNETLKTEKEGLKTELAAANTDLASKDKYIDHLETQLTTANTEVNSHANKVSEALKEAESYVGESE